MLARRLDSGLLYPDFEKLSILNIGRALKGYKVPAEFVLGPKTRVFILDGVGYNFLRRLFPQLEDILLPVSSILPTNTVVAIPAMLSGEIPAKYRYFGPFSKLEGKVVDLFKKGVQMPIATATYLIPSYLLTTPLSKSLRGRIVPYENHADLPLILKRVRERAIVYIPDTDRVLHRYGPDAQPSIETVKFWLNVIAKLSRDAEEVVVVSDHGMTKTGRQIPLVAYKLDPNAIFGDFRLLLTDTVFEDMPAYKLTKELTKKLYGVEEPPASFVVAPKDGSTYYPPGTEHIMLKTRGGMHGGATPDELLAFYIHGKGKEIAEILTTALS